MILLLACHDPDTLFERSIEASGGEAAWRRHTHAVYTSRLLIDGQDVPALMTEYARAPGDLWSIVEVPGIGRFESGVLGDVAWAVDPLAGPRLIDGAAADQARRAADYYAPLRWAERFPGRRLLGEVPVDGRLVWDVEATSPAGQVVHHQFDPATGLLVGLRSRVASEVGELESTTTFSAWIAFDGVLLPTRTEERTGPTHVVTTLQSVTWDPPDFPTLALPAEIVALRR